MGSLVVRQFSVSMREFPAHADGFRIAHVSDLHLRGWNGLLARLQQALVDESYDILVVTGDFSETPNRARRAADLTRRLFEPVRPPLGIYGVLGNHDHAALAEEDLPLTMLRDSVRLISIGDFGFHLAGVEQSALRRSRVEEVIGDLPDDVPLVVLAHYPSTVYELPPVQGTLMLSGHTHGGQIRLPGLGCVWTHDGIPTSLARGLHTVRGNCLHVTPGIGTSWPIRHRFLCPPELSVITIRSRQRVRQRRFRPSGGQKRVPVRN